jgi:hypothetical protein
MPACSVTAAITGTDHATPALARVAAVTLLAGYPATAVTVQLVGLAVEGGLRPQADPRRRRGLYRVFVNGPGRDALFGCIDISETTGRAVRAYLTHGNDGVERRYESVAGIRAVLASWAAIQRERNTHP